MGSTIKPGGRQTRQALTGAHEDLDAKLILQLTDLAAHAWLRRVQCFRDHGEVEALANSFPDRTQLLEVHKAQFLVACNSSLES